VTCTNDSVSESPEGYVSVYLKASLVRNIIFPLIDITNRSSVLRHLDLYEKSQWWSPEKLKELQERKLRRMVSHAWNNVPYYRRIFKTADIKPEEIKNVEDLKKLPVLTHENVRQCLDDLVAVNIPKRSLARVQTGGTTGHPLLLYADKNEMSSSKACLYRGWRWCGYKIGEKMAQIWGVPTVASKYKRLRERLRRLVTRNILVGAWNLSDKNVEDALKRLNKEKPTFLRGYASPIYLLAKFIEQNGINLEFEAAGISTTAEPLFDFQRETIERAFHCEVFDQYGCGEVNSMAFDCEEHTGLHIPIERVYIEFLSEKDYSPVSEEKTGRIVVTSLDNYGMPLIRYDTEDLGIKKDDYCSCGRKLPLMDSIVGRTIDTMKLPNGNILFGGFFVIALEDMEWIAKYGIIQFQVTQTKRNHIMLKIQSQRTPSEQGLRSFTDLIKRYIGDDVVFEIEFVDKIPVSASGKRRYILSTVSN